MTKTTALLCSLALTFLVARTAAAGVCADVDASRDNLPEPDRNALRTLLGSTLAQHGQQVTNQNCTETYLVYHVKLGNSVSVFLQGPQGYRQASARSVEDVPNLYSQMVRSLLTGQPMSSGNDTVDRQNATSQQAAPQRVEADSLWYVRLGYAGVVGKAFASGPSIGFGYRYELDNLGIDISAFNFMIDTGQNNSTGSGSSGSAGFTGSWIKLMGLYFMNPMANRSSYLGGGISWGGTALVDSGSTYSGTGLQAEVSAGYELLRASTIRMFIQADATLPLYALRQTTVAVGGALSTSTSYAPTFAVSFGLGWGRSLTRVHVIQ
jgi:hypothetical protein